jgi:hypothetical protein
VGWTSQGEGWKDMVYRHFWGWGGCFLSERHCSKGSRALPVTNCWAMGELLDLSLPQCLGLQTGVYFVMENT